MTDGGTEAGTKHIGSYEIVRELGHGGMAVVYLARQPGLERLVALKEMAAFGVRDPQMVHRFLREAQIAASLTHPNIVTVHEAFAVDAVPYISMEYVAAGSLRSLVGHLRLDQTIAVMEDMLAGLRAAELRGVVHRDLKPENVLITDDGRAKIADFGIAKAVDHAATEGFRTATGMTVGTPTYMAPEQAMGTKGVTSVADLYSVGIMAYELMVGRLPFDAESPVALLLKQVSDPPPPPLSINPSLDPELGAWIERLLVKDAAERTPTAAQAWDELEEIAIALLGPRWRRGAALIDPRRPRPTPAPLEDPSASGYLTVDPDRLAPNRPPTFPPQSTPIPGPWTPPPDPSAPAPPPPWTPPPDQPAWTPPPDPVPSAPPAGWTPQPETLSAPPAEEASRPPVVPRPAPPSGPPTNAGAAPPHQTPPGHAGYASPPPQPTPVGAPPHGTPPAQAGYRSPPPQPTAPGAPP
ncbi:serine/threonine-protein kinase, partial [Solirubrobacter deserti]